MIRPAEIETDDKEEGVGEQVSAFDWRPEGRSDVGQHDNQRDGRLSKLPREVDATPASGVAILLSRCGGFGAQRLAMRSCSICCRCCSGVS